MIRTPLFGRLADYIGVWAMEPRAASLLHDRIRSMDVSSHVLQGQAKPPKVHSQFSTEKASNGQKVAVITMTGPLMKAVSSADESGTSTVQLRRDIRDAANDPEISAIVLAIDSPGGTVAGTADLGAEVKAAAQRKPVMAFIDDLCASAAYWVASQADAIYANAATAQVGSIGTLAIVYDVSQQAAEEGVKTLVFRTGPLKGAGTPGEALTDDQKTYFQSFVDSAQESFDAAVKTGRGYSDSELKAVKTGGVFNTTEAKKLGLIDGIASLASVIDMAATSPKSKPTMRAQSSVPKGVKMLNADTETGLGTGSGTTAIVDPVATMRTAASAEIARQAAIHERAKGNLAIVAKAIAENWTPDQAELAALKASLPNNVGVPGAIVRRDNVSVDSLAAALMVRSGIKLDSQVFNSSELRYSANLPTWLTSDLNAVERDRMMNAGYKLRSMSLIDICREAVIRDGREVPYDHNDLIKAAVSGGTLTAIFTTSANASMIASYLQAPDTTTSWTTTEDVANFNSHERIRLETIGGTMKKLPRGGEADDATRSDKVESYRAALYAEKFAIDEQDIIDDSMNSLASTPSQMAQKAARLRPDLVYSILLGNPSLTATGRALFNTTEGNLGSSAPLNPANLKAAISAFMLVRENGVNLNIMPTHLIVPPTLVWTAKELVNSTQILIAGTAGTVTERGNINTLADLGLQIVADARLENGCVDPDSLLTNAGSSSSWYLASTMVETIKVGYQGGRLPRLRSFTLDQGKYGIGWDISLGIGAKAMDWRGLRKTTT